MNDYVELKVQNYSSLTINCIASSF